MRLRDRQSLLAALLLCSGYLSLALWLVLKAWQGLGGAGPKPLPQALSILISLNFGLLAWRLAVRAAFTGSAYGWMEAIRAVPRMAIGNVVLVLAAAAALSRYRASRRGGPPRWDKTEHFFPARPAAE
jgi:adsorption protein B